VLNRLYIVIGILVILVLGAAFIVPRLVPWGNYRARMETLASQALGADVRIKGDIRFSLLPAPHIEITDVAVGPAQAPVMSVNAADADFSLLDFLRDRYSMTSLVLDHPVLDLKIAADGSIDTGLKPAGTDSKANISVASAEIAVGTVNIVDAASGRVYALEGIDGDLSIGAIAGPFRFQGGGSVGDQHYGFRLTTAAFDAGGNTQVSFVAQPDGTGFSLSADGALATKGAPHFVGNLSYRQKPAGKDGNGLVGDLTFTSKVDATPAKIALSAFTLIPDENRAVTRVTGSGTIDLGQNPSFAATVSGGVLALPPRDATTEQGPQPYEFVRMLGELPAVPVPPIAGTISAEVGELDLRSFTLQDLRLAASTDGKQWSIGELSGRLPGNAAVKLAGDLGATDGRPGFSGTLSIATDRLDRLATLWRKPAPDNPLFNMPGSFQSKVSLLGQNMALTDGVLTLDGASHSLTALIKFGAQRRIDLSGQFKDLSAEDSAAVMALIPDLQHDPSAAVTFPQGAVSLAADSATLFGLPGKGLSIEGKWGNGSIELSQFAATDLGGASVDLSLALSGTLADPRIAGDGDIGIAAAGGPALDRIFDALGTPAAVRAFLARSLPVQLKAHLDDPKDNGAQGLSLSGKAGAADVTLVAQLDGGLKRALAAPISATLDMESGDPKAMTAQLGLGDVSLLPETGQLKLTASLDGPPRGTMKTNVQIAGGGDSIGFDGTVTPGELTAPSGKGRLTLALSDSSVLAAGAGLSGLYTPPVKGDADLSFVAGRSIALDNIAASSGVTGFAGNLALNSDAHGAVASGALDVSGLDVTSLAATVGSPTALMKSSGKLWPDGPIAAGDAPRTTTGSIVVKTPSLTRDGQPFITDAGFNFDWDARNAGVHGLTGQLGGGSISLSASLCCASQVSEKSVTGQASLKGVALSALLPPGPAATLGGALDGSVQFAGTGDSIEAVARNLSGDGSFTLSNLAVQKFDPQVFAAIASIDNIVDLDPKDLSGRVATALDQGAFSAPKLSGGFTIAGGVLRVPNVAAQTPTARLFGGTTLDLTDLSLGGSFALSPVGVLDPAGVVSETTSKVTANLSGTLTAPSRSLDIASMVDAIRVKALEVEVARLEALKAQDDARAKAAAIANKQAVEDQASKQLADQQAAEKAAAEEAARQAAAKQAAQAAARKAAQDAAASQQVAPAPFNLMPQAPFVKPLN
jgi:hypothetical protein